MEQIEYITECDYQNDACFDGMMDEVPEIWEDTYEELVQLITTGECSEEFYEEFVETIDDQWDSAGPYLKIDILTEAEYNDFDLTKENVYNLTDWQDRCGSYLDVATTPFGFVVWKWGKLRFILSGFERPSREELRAHQEKLKTNK